MLGDVPARTCWRSAPAPASARAGCARRAAVRSAWTSRCASCSTHAGSTSPGIVVPAVLRTAAHLPFADASFDVVFSSFGALQFVADIDVGGRRDGTGAAPRRPVRLLDHPPDPVDVPRRPGRAGLVASQSYWDRTPYVEVDDATGVVSYVEHHRTLSATGSRCSPGTGS